MLKAECGLVLRRVSVPLRPYDGEDVMAMPCTRYALLLAKMATSAATTDKRWSVVCFLNLKLFGAISA
jgi:hypothetical protein